MQELPARPPTMSEIRYRSRDDVERPLRRLGLSDEGERAELDQRLFAALQQEYLAEMAAIAPTITGLTTIAELKLLTKDKVAALLRTMQLSDKGNKPEMVERLWASLPPEQRIASRAVDPDVTPPEVSTQTPISHVRNLPKDEVAAALRARGLSDAGYKPELVQRLYAALQQGDGADAVEAAPADAHEPATASPSSAAPGGAAEQPPAAGQSAAPSADASSPAEQPAQAAEQGSASGAAAAEPPAPEPQAPVAAAAPAADSAAPSAASAPMSAASPAAVAAATSAADPAAAPAPQQAQQRALPECVVPTGLAVQWLGTSSGAPTAQRNVSSILLLQLRRVLMVDCGEVRSLAIIDVAQHVCRSAIVCLCLTGFLTLYMNLILVTQPFLFHTCTHLVRHLMLY